MGPSDVAPLLCRAASGPCRVELERNSARIQTSNRAMNYFLFPNQFGRTYGLFGPGE
jgi:hypothetical protein